MQKERGVHIEIYKGQIDVKCNFEGPKCGIVDMTSYIINLIVRCGGCYESTKDFCSLFCILS